MKTMKLIRLLADDIILRLNKLRDKRRDCLGFSQVARALERDINAKLAQFETITENLNAHRNTYIAHQSKGSREHLSPPVEMLEAIRLAVEIGDDLSGDRNQYKMLETDLRAEVLGGQTAEQGRCTLPGRHFGVSSHHVPCNRPGK